MISDNVVGPDLAETRRFAAVHKFAMSNEESNGETRPTVALEVSLGECPLTGQTNG